MSLGQCYHGSFLPWLGKVQSAFQLLLLRLKLSAFTVDFTKNLWYNVFRWFFSDGEMAERLMTLVLKVQPEPKKLDKPKVPPMLDIGFCCFGCLSDGKMSEKPAIRFLNKSDGRQDCKSNFG